MRAECLCALLLAAAAAAANPGISVDGHTKLTAFATSYPAESLLRESAGDGTLDIDGELRLNLDAQQGRLSFDAAWQLAALYSDDFGDAPPEGLGGFFDRMPDDERRLFDVTSVVGERADGALVQRLDRLWVGYADETRVLRLGRQALTWGGGLFYAPMDPVNPFDPAAIDTEYKAGDDMLYGQLLRRNGDDVQLAVVLRRNPASGAVDTAERTVAAKYRGFAGAWDYDVLVAESYDDSVIGIGVGRGIGGAAWRAEAVYTHGNPGGEVQLLTNLAYSRVFAGRNLSGVLEYHFNGFGQRGGRYAPADLVANPALLERLERRQTFTVGRHYLAGSVTIEMTPLVNLSPVALVNLSDPSALLQLTAAVSLADNATFTGSLNLPVGAAGTEYGGIESPVPGRTLAAGLATPPQAA